MAVRDGQPVDIAFGGGVQGGGRRPWQGERAGERNGTIVADGEDLRGRAKGPHQPEHWRAAYAEGLPEIPVRIVAGASRDQPPALAAGVGAIDAEVAQNPLRRCKDAGLVEPAVARLGGLPV